MSLKLIKNLSVLLIVIMSFLSSCSNNDPRLVRLNQLDSLLEISPRAAYDSLNFMKSQIRNPQVVSVDMKYRMLLAKAQNKLYLQMPSDSVFQEVVSYYDKKGSPNEKMEAHYLNGCIYRDQNEAPQAMKCFQDAVEMADTLSKDCDYITLFSIYGQMSDIYARQNLIDEAIAAMRQYSKYALKAKDTYNYIRGKEFLIPYYYMRGDTASAISQTQKCIDLYEKNGLYKEAVGAYPTLIEIYINRKQYHQAGVYLEKLERESGLFDDKHDIVYDRQAIYDLFGQYYVGVGKIDLAECYFRKLRLAGFGYEASKGLLTVYKKKNDIDSIVKYAMRSEEAIKLILQKSATDAVKQSASLYDYSRLEKESFKKELKLEYEKVKFWGLCFVVLCCVLFAWHWYRKLQKSKKKELATLNDDYVRVQKDYRQLEKEIKAISEDKEAVIKEKKSKIEELEKVVDDYRCRYANMDARQKLSAWLNSDVVVRFKEMAKPKLGQKCPAEDDWKDLSIVMEQCLPIQYDKIFNGMSLGNQEQQVCLLLCAGFSNGEMSILLNTSAQRITNVKSKANEKLFDVKNAGSLQENLLGLTKV